MPNQGLLGYPDTPAPGDLLVFDGTVWCKRTLTVVTSLGTPPTPTLTLGADAGGTPTGVASWFNGNTATGDYTSIGSGTVNLVCDFGATPPLITKLRLWMYYGDSRTYTNVKVSVSNDGTTWTDIYGPTTTNFFTAGGYVEITNATAYRYWRIHSEGSSVNSNNELVELQFFAQSVASVTLV